MVDGVRECAPACLVAAPGDPPPAGAHSHYGRLMDVARLVLDYLNALAWPVLVGLAIWWFRQEIRELIGRIRSASGFGVALDLGEVTEDVQEASQALEEGRLEDADASLKKLSEELVLAGMVKPWSRWSTGRVTLQPSGDVQNSEEMMRRVRGLRGE